MLHDPKFGGQGCSVAQFTNAAEPSLPDQDAHDTRLTAVGQTPLSDQRTDATHDSTVAQSTFGGQFCCESRSTPAPDTAFADQYSCDNRMVIVGEPHSDESRREVVTHLAPVLVGTIIAEARRYEDYTRARQRLLLQAMATCRSFCGGDKAAGAKLYRAQTPEISVWLAPYEAAMAPLDSVIKDQKKVLEKLAKQLPEWKWCEGIGGVGPYMLARIIGAAGRPISDYRSPAALWKRFMLAVDDGKRQWKDASPAARAIVWNVGECIIKAQIRNPKGEDGKPTGDRFAIGPLGQIYLDRREHESVTIDTAGHIHNRAKRYMEKRFLRDLWRESRK